MRKLTAQENPSVGTADGGKGRAIGAILLIGLIVPQITWILKGYENVGYLEKSAWSFYVAAILAFTVRQQGKSFVFDGLLWIFKNIHIPRSELFAYVYSVAFLILGLVELHSWLHLTQP